MLKKFIETVVKNKKVFYLEVDESFAMCGSQAFYIEESKEAIPVALFWEDEKQAAACKADEWAKGIVKSADLSGGEELVPVDLVKALVYEIERTKTAVTFSDSFESLAQVKQLLNQIELDITDEEAL